MGNTCYANAALQLLSNSSELTEILDNRNNITKMKINSLDSDLLQEYNELRILMQSDRGTIRPNRFICKSFEISRKKNGIIFFPLVQQDVSEYIQFILSCIHDSISKPTNVTISGKAKDMIDELAVECYKEVKRISEKEHSEIMTRFYGVYASQIINLSKEVLSTRPEMFSVLNLSIPKKENISIYDCFDNYVEKELLTGDNEYLNEKTNKKETVYKKISFWSLPSTLIICLKRFTIDGSNKNNAHVDYPISNLDLSRYISGYNPHNYVYDLYGVANHSGSLDRGHYTAIIQKQDGGWYLYDDDIVSKINGNYIMSPMSYCLFYRKKNN
jgi:ubiquitin carboxyl-terminal hydrolase 2